MALVAPPPRHSLAVSINVGAGMRQMVRSLGTYNGYYPSVSAATENYVELGTGQTWVGASMSAIMVNTNRPVQFLGTRLNDTTFTITVNSMLFLDQPLKGWEVQNNSVGTANLFIASVAPQPQASSGIVPQAIVSVNGQLPDANGNVQIDTGVMTVGGDSPDASGNIELDEKTYNP